jgi:hypothetical protein
MPGDHPASFLSNQIGQNPALALWPTSKPKIPDNPCTTNVRVIKIDVLVKSQKYPLSLDGRGSG